MVTLRHTGGYETMYLHLSSIAVRVGQRVNQGDVIGRVGSSGLSTGPHLDYRIRKNGVYVNPVAEHRRMPPGEPIPAAHLSAFLAERDRLSVLLPSDSIPALSSVPAKATATPPAEGDSRRAASPRQTRHRRDPEPAADCRRYR